jgi:hypothetical protein
MDMYSGILEDNIFETSVFLAFGRAVTAELSAKSVQHIALLDGFVCPLCSDLDGSTYEVGSEEYYLRMPPVHSRCRCVYEYSNEAETGDNPTILNPETVKKHGQLMGIIESMRNIYVEKVV